MKSTFVLFFLLGIQTSFVNAAPQELDEDTKAHIDRALFEVYQKASTPRHATENEEGFAPIDILKGSKYNKHLGNKLLRKVVQKCLYVYVLKGERRVASYLADQLSEYGVAILEFDGEWWSHLDEESCINRVELSFKKSLQSPH